MDFNSADVARDRPSVPFSIFVQGTNQRVVSLCVSSFLLENELSHINNLTEVTQDNTLEHVLVQLQQRHLTVTSHRVQQFFVYPPVSLAPLPWSLRIGTAGVLSGSTLHLRTRVLGGARSSATGKIYSEAC